MKDERREADELNELIDRVVLHGAEAIGVESSLDKEMIALASDLQAMARATPMREGFVRELEKRLRAQPAAQTSRRWSPLAWRRWATKKINDLRGGSAMNKHKIRRWGLAIGGAAALLVALLVGSIFWEGSSQQELPLLPLLSSMPALAQEWNPQQPFGALGDVELVLEADLPKGPGEASVYRVTAEPVPSTPEQVLSWAGRFGLSEAKVYRDPRDPDALIVIGSEGQRLVIRWMPFAEVHYSHGDFLAGWPQGPEPPSFAAAKEAAVAFLRDHGLLPEAYRVEEPDYGAPPAPIRCLRMVPEIDGLPVGGHGSEMNITVGPDGQVLYASLRQMAFERDGVYPLKSAEEALEELRTGDHKGPFRLSIEWRFPPEPEPPVTRYTREQPDYVVGDEVTIRSHLQLLQEVGGDDIRATLSGPDGLFKLSGPCLAEMTDLGFADVQVRGTIEDKLGPRGWRLAVASWEKAPQRQVDRFLVAVESVGKRVIVKAEDGTRYRLLDPPADLHQGQSLAVYAEVVLAEGDEPPTLRWFSIESPPATQQYASSSESVSVVVEKEVLETAPGPVPVEQVIVGTLHFEEGGPVLETPEGQRCRLVGLPDELNNGRDGRVIAVRGQVTPPAEGGDLPTLVWVAQEPVPEPAELHQEIEIVIQPVEVEKEVIGESSMEVAVPVRPEPGFEPPQSLYKVGDEVEIEGMISAVIYTDGTQRKVEAWLMAGLGPDYDLRYQLSGPPVLLEELAQHDRLHLRVKGRIVAEGEYPQGQTLEVESFEKIWPDEKVWGYLGTIGIETLDGKEVAVFTDDETGQRYVLLHSLTPHFTRHDYHWTQNKRLYLQGVERPDLTYAGLPVIEEAGAQAGSRVDAATSADQLPLEHPQVVDERTMPKRMKGKAIIERVELAYYAPPGALGERPGAEVRPEFSLVQPVWVFHGHSEDGQATFVAYVQAVADDYLR